MFFKEYTLQSGQQVVEEAYDVSDVLNDGSPAKKLPLLAPTGQSPAVTFVFFYGARLAKKKMLAKLNGQKKTFMK